MKKRKRKREKRKRAHPVAEKKRNFRQDHPLFQVEKKKEKKERRKRKRRKPL